MAFKELFNGFVKTTLSDSDRIVVGVPGQEGSDNISWLNFKTLIYDLIDYLGIINYTATGIRNGFQLSINADPQKINIAAGIGYIVDNVTTPASPVKTKVTYSGVTGLVLTNRTSAQATYLAVDINGTVIQQTTRFTPEQARSYLIIGAAIHTNLLTVNAINNFKRAIIDGVAQFQDVFEALGAFNIEGNVFYPDGANLTLNKTEGRICKSGANFSNNPRDPHRILTPELLSPSTLRYRTQSATYESANTQFIDPNNYDLAGVITSMPVNKFQVQRFALFESNLVRIQYGQEYYNNMEDAVAAITTEPYIYNSNIAENGLLRSYLIIKQGCTNLNTITEAKFINADKFGSISGTGSGTTNHNDLNLIDGGEVGFYGHLTEQELLNLQNSGYKDYGFVTNDPDVKKTYTFNPATGVFEITGDLSYYRQGKFNDIGVTTKSITLPTNANAEYYIYFDNDTATLEYSTVAWSLNSTKVFVYIIVFRTGTPNKFIPLYECHTAQFPRQVHRYLHATQGTKLVSGGTISGITLNGTTDAQNTFGVDETVISDEDLRSTLNALADGTGAGTDYTIMYRSGSIFTWETDQPVPFKYTVAGYMNYDNSGTLTQAANNKYINIFLLAINTEATAKERFICVTGQTEHATDDDAYLETWETFNKTGFNFTEFDVLYQITYETNSGLTTKGKCRANRVLQATANSVVSGSSLSTVTWDNVLNKPAKITDYVDNSLLYPSSDVVNGMKVTKTDKSTTLLSYDFANMRLGVEFTTPEAKLHLYETTSLKELLKAESSFYNRGFKITIDDLPSIQSYVRDTDAIHPLLINPNGGNIGIGTLSTPTEMLDVNGTIKSLKSYVQKDNLLATEVIGIELLNTTPATVSDVLQKPPYLNFKGNVYIGGINTVQNGYIRFLPTGGGGRLLLSSLSTYIEVSNGNFTTNNVISTTASITTVNLAKLITNSAVVDLIITTAASATLQRAIIFSSNNNVTEWARFFMGFLGIGNQMPTTAIDLGGLTNRTIQVSRNTTNNTEGQNLTINAGGATAQGAISALSVTPTSGGIGYAVGDLLTIDGGNGGIFIVQAITNTPSIGIVTSISLIAEGTGYTTGTGKTTTGGSGTGCTVNITAIRTGGTNKTGGDLELKSGISTGNEGANLKLFSTPKGISGTADNIQVEAVRIDSGQNINTLINKPKIQAASLSSDTIGDTYINNLAGVFKIAYCTVANAVKLAGTWVDRFVLLANGNIEIGGFTKLGDASIKVKKITGTTGAAEGDGVSIAHGLTGSKIISFTAKVEFSTNNGVAQEHSSLSGYQFHINHDATNFNVGNHATNSENILSKPIIITIIYEE